MKLHISAGHSPVCALRRIILVLAGLLLLSNANAAIRKDSIEVFGQVKDILTGKDVGAGLVMVYNEADSLVLTDSLQGRHKESIGAWSYEVDGGFRFKLPHGGKYKIAFIVDGYNETPQDLVIPDRKYNKFPPSGTKTSPSSRSRASTPSRKPPSQPRASRWSSRATRWNTTPTPSTWQKAPCSTNSSRPCPA